MQENIPTGKVQYSCSAATAPMVFLCKKDGFLKLCIAYRAPNCLRIPSKCPLLLISKLLNKTRGRKWFARLDLKNRYNLIRIAAAD